MFAIPDLGGSLWTGTRLRAPLSDSIYLFTGGFVASTATTTYRNPVAGATGFFETTSELVLGPRLGVDVSFGRHVLLTIEYDLGRGSEPGQFFEGTWHHTGGLALSYMF
ncbi:hypothetical protein AKJ08_0415 [Vulgatibacter incomptus]|uniref:Uncharacterized protein n=1 Tax=Vulgatibacter incomptus TaxID=1391653 RepID=A0A0K1P919_9BACT|nr:hypothetical protein AKJ08_0415 [Vulgatibacter incomptus]